MSEEFVKGLKTLIASGRGDAGRLREILEAIRQGSPVYMSDYKYVQSLTEGVSGESKTAGVPDATVVHLGDPLELLKIRLAEGKITIEEFRELKKAIRDL